MKKLFLFGIISLMSIVANAQNPKKIFENAKNSFNLEQYQDVIPLLQQCIEKEYYQNGDTYWLLINSYLQIGQNENGLKAANEAVRMYPDNPYLLYMLFTAYYKNNDIKGVDVGNKVLETSYIDDPETKRDILYWIGELCYFNEQYKEAIPYYRQCLDIDPDYIYAINYLGVSLYNEGVDIYNKLANMTNSDTPEYKDLFSRLEKDSNEAFLLLEKGFKSPSTDISTKIALAECLAGLCSIFNAPEFKEKETYYTKFVESGGNM